MPDERQHNETAKSARIYSPEMIRRSSAIGSTSGALVPSATGPGLLCDVFNVRGVRAPTGGYLTLRVAMSRSACLCFGLSISWFRERQIGRKVFLAQRSSLPKVRRWAAHAPVRARFAP